ncbi:ribosome hibernation-promoting factor, HPF/YfiA family [Vallitalea sp.]|jgi:putative sigma-54 modulation protein|uniref:ribosome hibernation-promoting factor, HPF/YfiA family n=1 Tax=Vallitalea sp. TaxID=1882829 RepID=UPI0025CBF043|nr:ribosome-associated translation inhibitor RaiA [Vallitalea sp.]MCT4688625.1 ribosome-associated translation inhibitor RaiA [Vallitalea sp.]
MRYIISGKNIEITKALREATIDKLSKMDKYFNPDNEAQITMSVQKLRHIIEVTIPIKGSIIRAEESAENMYTAIDKVVDVLERQLLKHKNKLISRHHSAGTFKNDFVNETMEEDLDDKKIEIVRTKRFAMKPMNAMEACLQMDLLGHDFFVFMNSDTEEVNVVYRRKNGAYGLIEPTF